MSKDNCWRCGVCCIVHPCYAFSGYEGHEDDESFDCPFLLVHEDMTTSCTNKEAQRIFIGTGCTLQKSPEINDYRKRMLESPAIITRKKKMLRRVQDGSHDPRKVSLERARPTFNTDWKMVLGSL